MTEPFTAWPLFVGGQDEDRTPEHCPAPAKHPLGTGRVYVWWRPCQCPQAGPLGGHRAWSCVACSAEHVQSVVYFAPCWWAERDAADLAAGLPVGRGRLIP